eukprot:Pgem_evm3s127
MIKKIIELVFKLNLAINLNDIVIDQTRNILKIKDHLFEIETFLSKVPDLKKNGNLVMLKTPLPLKDECNVGDNCTYVQHNFVDFSKKNDIHELLDKYSIGEIDKTAELLRLYENDIKANPNKKDYYFLKVNYLLSKFKNENANFQDYQNKVLHPYCNDSAKQAFTNDEEFLKSDKNTEGANDDDDVKVDTDVKDTDVKVDTDDTDVKDTDVKVDTDDTEVKVDTDVTGVKVDNEEHLASEKEGANDDADKKKKKNENENKKPIDVTEYKIDKPIEIKTSENGKENEIENEIFEEIKLYLIITMVNAVSVIRLKYEKLT